MKWFENLFSPELRCGDRVWFIYHKRKRPGTVCFTGDSSLVSIRDDQVRASASICRWEHSGDSRVVVGLIFTTYIIRLFPWMLPPIQWVADLKSKVFWSVVYFRRSLNSRKYFDREPAMAAALDSVPKKAIKLPVVNND